MNDKDIRINWYYFCSLASQLQKTTQFVDHVTDQDGRIINGETFSNEFAKILLLACSEFEVIAKSLCKESGIILRWNANIVSITKEILKLYPNINQTEISTPYQTYKPLEKWHIVLAQTKKGNLSDKVAGIDWWDFHNNIKHNRSDYFKEATLRSCIDSMSSLMVLELYLCRKVLKNLDLISKISCEYFSFKYGLFYLAGSYGDDLPDF